MVAFEWIGNEKVLVGAGIAIAGAIIAWVLRKSFNRERSGPVPMARPGAHGRGPRQSSDAAGSNPEGDRSSSMTYAAAMAAMAAAPESHRASVEKHYIGKRVRWETKFSSTKPQDDGTLLLSLAAGGLGDWVLCVVLSDAYPELSTMHRGTRVLVSGEIESLVGEVRLKNVQLQFLN